MTINVNEDNNDDEDNERLMVALLPLSSPPLVPLPTKDGDDAK